MVSFKLLAILAIIAYAALHYTLLYIRNRYHLEIKGIGFRSLTGIKYTRNVDIPGTKKLQKILEVCVRKIKIRFRHPAQEKSAPWVTLHIKDVSVYIPSLAPLTEIAVTPNRRKSVVSRIPWWKTLSIVRWILATLYTIPAQFLLSGLANYVGVKVDGIKIVVDGIGKLEVASVECGLVLFANKGDLGTEGEVGRISKQTHEFHSYRNYHHLFGDKRLEVKVIISGISVTEPSEYPLFPAFELPSQATFIIACHLSSSCTSLKDVQFDADIPYVMAYIDGLLRIQKALKSSKLSSSPPKSLPTFHPKDPSSAFFPVAKDKPPSSQPPAWLRLLKSFTIAVTKIQVIVQPHEKTPKLSLELSTFLMTFTPARENIQQNNNVNGNNTLAKSVPYIVSSLLESITLDLVMPNSPKTSRILDVGAVDLSVKASMFHSRKVLQEVNPNDEFVWFNGKVEEPRVILDNNSSDGLILLVAAFTSANTVSAAEPMSSSSSSPSLPWLTEEPPKPVKDNNTALPRLDISFTIRSASLRILSLQLAVPNLSLAITSSYTIPPASETYAPAPSGLRKRIRALHGHSDLSDSPQFLYISTSKLSIPTILVTLTESSLPILSVPELTISLSTTSPTTMAGINSEAMKKDEGKSKPGKITFNNAVKLIMRQRREPMSVKVVKETSTAFIQIALGETFIRIGRKETEILQIVIEIMKKLSAARSKKNTQGKVTGSEMKNQPMLALSAAAIGVGISMERTRIILESTDVAVPESEIPRGSLLEQEWICNAPREDISAGMEISLGGISGACGGSLAPMRDEMEKIISLNDFKVLSFVIGRDGERIHKSEEKLVHIPLVTARMEEGTEQTILSIDVQKIDINYSISGHYCALLGILALLRSIKSNHEQQNPEETATNKSKEKIKKVRNLEFRASVKELNLFANLPGKLPLFLRIASLQSSSNSPLLSIAHVGLFGVHPDPAGAVTWDELLRLESISLSITNAIILNIPALYLRIPFNYIFADVIDGFISTMKIAKQLNSRLVNGHALDFNGSDRKDSPIAIPTVELELGVLCIRIDDDPFESKLGLIWRAGLIEQKQRLNRDAAFVDKVKAIYAVKGCKEEEYENVIKVLDGKLGTAPFFLGPPPSAEANISVREAHRTLLEFESKNWMRKIAVANETRKKVLEDAFEYDESIPILIAPPPDCPYLLNATLKQVHMKFSQPSFPLTDVRKFMNDVGKGIPHDFPLSTLIPLNMQWRIGETLILLRDYPLPLIYVPSEGNKESWSLEGDHVIADELGDLEATRHIIEPILHPDTALAIPSFSIVIPRTASPTKFYSIIQVKVHTPSPTLISWSQSVQPAIQEVAQIFDTFTRPNPDPSKKVGFWDKLCLMIHTRTRIDFSGNGDCAMTLKGSRDPYLVDDQAAGLVKVWKGNVSLRIGFDNREGEFLQVDSDEYVLGVPDLERGGYTLNTLNSSVINKKTPEDIGVAENISKLEQNNSEYSENSRAATFKSTESHASKMPTYATDPAFCKVILKLAGGVRLGIGCQMERMCQAGCPECGDRQECRSLEFKPHWKVKFKNPDFVRDVSRYDAFTGYRSDFLHCSLSVQCPIKHSNADNEDNADGELNTTVTPYNSAHFTSRLVDHFLKWLTLFGGEMSIPIKQGPLWPKDDDRPSLKIGKHLSTLKFKFCLAPIFLSYVYREPISNEQDGSDREGTALGLKGKMAHLNIDMHHRREMVNEDDEHLGSRSKASWSMHEAEFDLAQLDLRAVAVRFLADDLSPVFDDGSSAKSGSLVSKLNGSNDPDWMDVDDYVELGEATPDGLPAVKVVPFMYSPQVIYFKQTDLEDSHDTSSLAGTHDCIMGRCKSTQQVQEEIFRERLNFINKQIEEHHERLEDIENSIRSCPDKPPQELLDESYAIVEKTGILFEKKQVLTHYLKSIRSNSKHARHPSSPMYERAYKSLWKDKSNYFAQHYLIHNPQIIWNNSIRNLVLRFFDLSTQWRGLQYYSSTRAVKFLKDLKKKSNITVQKVLQDVVDSDDENGQDVADELIKLLVSEEDTKFVVPNEMESAVGENGSVASQSDSQSQQWDFVPEGYTLQPDYLVELFNAQFSLQSEKNPDSTVLLSTERAQIKAFKILDNNETLDEDNRVVKNRTVLNIDNAQFFTAQKGDFSEDELLCGRFYGVNDLENWPTWIPMEILIDDKGKSGKFQRITEKTKASLQYDNYNSLRLKSNNSSSDLNLSGEPFDNHCDSVYLNFPRLIFSSDSKQYETLHHIVSDLFLYSEPARKERLDKLKEILLAADMDDLDQAAETVQALQDQIRYFKDERVQLYRRLQDLGEDGHDYYQANEQALIAACEDLYLLMEAITKAQISKKEARQSPRTNIKVEFSADEMIWTLMQDSKQPLCEATLSKPNFVWVSKEDQSAVKTLEIDRILLLNKLPSPLFYELIGPYMEGKKMVDFSRQKMLRVYLRDLAAVGGIEIVEHVEINFFPLKFQMNYDLGKTLAAYFFSERRPPDANIGSDAVTPTASPSLPVPQVHGKLQRSLSMSELSLGVNGRSSKTASLSPKVSSSEASSISEEAHKDTKDTDTESAVSEAGSKSSDVSLQSNPKKMPTRQDSKAMEPKTPKLMNDNVKLMKTRSKNRTFIYIKIPARSHCLSYQGPKEKNIEDLFEFVFNQPTLEYRNKTWSWLDLAQAMKKDFLKIAISHAGALVKEKLKMRRPRAITHSQGGSPTASSPKSGVSPSHRNSIDDTRISPSTSRTSLDSIRRSLDGGNVEIPTLAVVDLDGGTNIIEESSESEEDEEDEGLHIRHKMDADDNTKNTLATNAGISGVKHNKLRTIFGKDKNKSKDDSSLMTPDSPSSSLSTRSTSSSTSSSSKSPSLFGRKRAASVSGVRVNDEDAQKARMLFGKLYNP